MSNKDQKRVILCTRNAAKQIEAALRQAIGDGLDVIENPSKIPAAIERADALFCPDFFYTAEVAQAVKRNDGLDWIQLLTAGCDNVLRHGVTGARHGHQRRRCLRRLRRAVLRGDPDAGTVSPDARYIREPAGAGLGARFHARASRPRRA